MLTRIYSSSYFPDEETRAHRATCKPRLHVYHLLEGILRTPYIYVYAVYDYAVRISSSVIIFKIFQWIRNEIHWINPANTAKIQPIQPKFEKSGGLARKSSGLNHPNHPKESHCISDPGWMPYNVTRMYAQVSSRKSELGVSNMFCTV